MELSKLTAYETKVSKIDRFAGVGVVTAVTAFIIGSFVTSWLPVLFLAVPALAGIYGILVGGISGRAKWLYFTNIEAEKDSEIKRNKKNYPSLYGQDWERFNNRTRNLTVSSIAKSIFTGKPAKVVFDTKPTDSCGGYIESRMEVQGYKILIGEKHYPSDIEMWKSAYDNAVKLK